MTQRKKYAPSRSYIGKESSDIGIWLHTRVGRQVDPQDFHTVGDRYGQFKIGFHNEQTTFDQVPVFFRKAPGPI